MGGSRFIAGWSGGPTRVTVAGGSRGRCHPGCKKKCPKPCAETVQMRQSLAVVTPFIARQWPRVVNMLNSMTGPSFPCARQGAKFPVDLVLCLDIRPEKVLAATMRRHLASANLSVVRGCFRRIVVTHANLTEEKSVHPAGTCRMFSQLYDMDRPSPQDTHVLAVDKDRGSWGSGRRKRRQNCAPFKPILLRPNPTALRSNPTALRDGKGDGVGGSSGAGLLLVSVHALLPRRA